MKSYALEKLLDPYGPTTKYLLILFIIILLLTTPILPSIFGIDTNPEHSEYIEIRDYSNCTKTNDSLCFNAKCIHAYRACQIEHCGSEGIGW
jgi:hypothetical protein